MLKNLYEALVCRLFLAAAVLALREEGWPACSFIFISASPLSVKLGVGLLCLSLGFSVSLLFSIPRWFPIGQQ